MRSSIAKRGSPKMPMANVVVKTMVMAQINVAAAVKTGGKRAAIQTHRGLSEAMASSRVHGWFGRKIRHAHTADTTESASAASASSRLAGGPRINDASPMMSGAMVIVPSPSEATQ